MPDRQCKTEERQAARLNVKRGAERGKAVPRRRPPADVQTGLLRHGVSKAGRTICLSLDCGGYEGAGPYYTVAYLRLDGRRCQVVRYTPFRNRGEWLFERFCEDVIDPAALAPGQ
jgi:hypothetical protein